MRLQGKSALVTGAARGIGAAFVRAYVAEGATVAIGDIDVARAEATAADIGPAAYAVRLDVTDQASIDAAMAQVVARAGGLDILVNNAAVFDAAPIVEITAALLAQYTETSASPRRPAWLAMLMILPPRPCAIICFAAACRQKSVPPTLMRNSRS